MTTRTLKNVAPLVVAVCAFALLGNGCSHSTAPLRQQIGMPLSIPYVSNPSNPFDWVGIWHNEVLDFFINHPGDHPCTISHAGIEDTMKLWWQDSMLCPNYLALGDSIDADSSNIYTFINTYASKGAYSASEKGWLDQIAHITDSAIAQQYDSAQFINAIENVEATVLANDPDSTRAYPLGMASVARNSYVYWLAQSENPSTPWPTCIISTASKGKGATPSGFWDDFLGVAGSDYSGFLEGATVAVASGAGEAALLGGPEASGFVIGASGFLTGAYESIKGN